MLQYNYIIDSVVKINDFYFQTQNKQEMRYIICHKVGHRFGLRHTNKDFGNPNLGDCMDYTNHPKDNMGPDITDFEALANINRVVWVSATRTAIKTAQVNQSDGDVTPKSLQGRGGDKEKATQEFGLW